MSLESIRKRVEAATEGPWAVGIGWQHERYVFGPIPEGETGHPVLADICGVENSSENADFIAHARTDLPLLLAVAEAAEEVCGFYGIEWESEGFATAHKHLCAALKALEEGE